MRQEITYAFIDSQNLHLGIRNQGWRLDYRKFRIFLWHKYRVSKAYIFIGYLPSNGKLYRYLESVGYELIYKKVLILKSKSLVKGNVDAELVLHTAKKEFDSYDKCVVVSGDGDFYCLYQFLIEEKKLKKILIPDPKHYSSLLNEFKSWMLMMNSFRRKLEK